MNITIHKNGEQLGPFTDSRVVEMLNSGQLALEDLAWTEGLDQWKPLSSFEHLHPIPAQATPPTPLPLPYKNRSVGLTIFGILTILLGCVTCLVIPLMLFGQMAASKTSGSSAPVSTILPAVFIYGVLAVALIWLGIGSIMARRWARALLLIFSWCWLLIGVVTVVFMAFLLPNMLANLPSDGTSDHPAVSSTVMTGIMIGAFTVVGIIYVILPAIWTFFYSSRHVKATCETRDPVRRWTDACPLPVLAICLWLAFSSPMMLLAPLVGQSVMPFFGMFLTGVPAALFCLAAAVIWGYSAWSLYKLEQRGWWVLLIALCVFMVSAILTFAHQDMLEMYRLMGLPDSQIEQIQKSGFLDGNRMAWLMAFFTVPFLGYLLFIKKYLVRR
jgi:hypothetical protein